MASNLQIKISASDAASPVLAALKSSLASIGAAFSAPVTGALELGKGLGMLGVAAGGLSTLASGVGSLAASFVSGNRELENASAKINAFTKDSNLTAGILADIRKEADKTPFAFQEMANATSGLMSSAKAAGVPLMDLVKQAEILAASNPSQGLEGAAFALREAVSGDFTSLIERFDLPRQYINNLKDQGVPAVEIVRKAMLQMGYDADLVAGMATTLDGRWSTFSDTLAGFKNQATESLFEGLKTGLVAAQGWLDENRDTLEMWAARVNAAFSIAIDGVQWLVGAFADGFGGVLDVVSSVGQAIYEALSWINPFATHSPALVDQVADGVNEIVGSYRDLGQVSTPLDFAKQAVQDFAGASKEAVKDMVTVNKDQLDGMKDALNAAKEDLRRWSDTPIEGSKAFEDQIDAINIAIDKAKLNAANIKLQRPGAKDKAGQEAYKAAVQAAEDEVSRLQMQADQVKLEERVKLDPLRKQLKDIAKYGEGGAGSVEKPFEVIKQGLLDAKKNANALEPAVKQMENLVKAQEKIAASMKSTASGGGGAAKAIASAGSSAGSVIKPISDAAASLAEWQKKLSTGRQDVEKFFAPVSNAWAGLFGEVVQDEKGDKIVERRVGGLVKQVRDAFTNGGFAGVGQLAYDAVAAEFGEVDWAGVWSNVKGMAASVGAWLGGVWASVPWADVWAKATAIGESISKSVGSITAYVTGWLSDQWSRIRWGEVWAAVENVGNSVAVALGDISAKIRDWFVYNWNSVEWATAAANLKKISLQARDIFDSEALGEEIGRLMVKSIIATMVQPVIWIKLGPQVIESIISGLQPKEAGDAVGRLLGTGVIKGIRLQLEESWEDLRKWFAAKLAGLLKGTQQGQETNMPTINIPSPLASGSNSSSGSAFRALGGPVSAGRDYTVGEHGVEVFRPSTSGTIIPNDKLGGSTSIVCNFYGPTDGASARDGVLTAARRLGLVVA